MPYLNLDVDYFDHIKTKRLVGLLGRGAEVLPIKLWGSCAKHHAESGKLTGYSTQEIEATCDWWGLEGQMVEAMVKVGFLDETEDGYQIHDWLDHAGHLAAFKARAIYAARKRWGKLGKRSNASSMLKTKSSNAPYRSRLGRLSQVGSEKGESEGGKLGLTVERLVERYNSRTPDECPAINTISPARRDKAKRYIKMFPEETFWIEAFDEIHKSKFLRGMKGSPGHEGFVANLDWLLAKGKDGTENVVKVAEGRYRDG